MASKGLVRKSQAQLQVKIELDLNHLWISKDKDKVIKGTKTQINKRKTIRLLEAVTLETNLAETKNWCQIQVGMDNKWLKVLG